MAAGVVCHSVSVAVKTIFYTVNLGGGPAVIALEMLLMFDTSRTINHIGRTADFGSRLAFTWVEMRTNLLEVTMNKLKLPMLLPLLALVAVLLVLQPSMSAQQESPSSDAATQQQHDPASPPAATPQASESQTFTGKIAKAGSKMVLKDSATNATYALDDQDKAKQFVGQTVRVTGRLDPQSNTIRVATIEPGS